MNNIEELKKAAMKATQGEWWQDVVETEGTYGVGDDCSEGFHSYAVYGPDNNSLLDMTNSTAAIIHTEEDGDYLMAWDETGRRNAEYIALANPAAILDLIAQLEAIQKERGVYAAIYEDVGAIITLLQGNEWDEHVAKTNMGGALEHQITRLINSIADINTKLLAAEAALSAANEKLKGEQVPVAVIVLSKNWPDTGSKVIDYYIEKIQHLPVGTELFTAPQKPVVLSSSTVMSRAYVVQAIKAAGFTVEGE
ncbi:ead/Ea22-like family protein [Yersinia sp. 2105 StPb PI]|nr:ead/Ea22-like family protein [Yersinia sp. 2105 StPb PI]RXA94002.1 hypothetical protein EQP49_21095 [Yersinia sp. 2105 StPb PI]